MLKYTTVEDYATKENDSTSWDSPPPTLLSSRVEIMGETLAEKEKEDIQHLVNTHSTVIQQPLDVGSTEKAYNQDSEMDSKPQEFIQHSTRDKGESEGVEQAKSEGVLQNTPQQENQSAQTQTKRSPQGRNEQNPFQVGEQIVDVLTKIQGFVVGIEGEKVIFNCREFGRVWRQ